MTAPSVVLPEDRNGPPGSANGGFAAGTLAAHARRGPGPGGAVEVTLRRPPPLGRPLTIERDDRDGTALLRDGDDVLAQARPAVIDDAGDVPDVGLEEARAAGARPEDFPLHPFRTCFGCGPDRDPATAVRVLCGTVGHRPGIAAAAWTPPPALADDDGLFAPELVWVALDCPSSVPVVAPGSAPHVLGRLTARVDGGLRAGEEHVVVAWALGREGRKAHAASAVCDAAGRVRAVARATWIALRD